MERNIAHCPKCNEEMIYQIPDLDVLVPLNRGDMILICKAMNIAFCGVEWKTDEGEHIWSHRLVRELQQYNPTDQSFADSMGLTEDPMVSLLKSIFGDNVIFAEIDLPSPDEPPNH